MTKLIYVTKKSKPDKVEINAVEEQRTESIPHVKNLEEYIKLNGYDPKEVDILCS